MAINPLILLQGQVPSIQPAINNFRQGMADRQQQKLAMQKNRLLAMQEESQGRELRQNTLLNSARVFVPRIQSGDVDGARQHFQTQLNMAQQSGNTQLVEDFSEGLQMLDSRPDLVMQRGQQLLDSFGASEHDPFARTLGVTQIVDEDGTVRSVVPRTSRRGLTLLDVGVAPKVTPEQSANLAGVKEREKLKAQLEVKPTLIQEEAKAKRRAELDNSKTRIQSSLEGTNIKNDLMNDLLDTAKSQSGFWTTGLLGQALNRIGGTPANDLRQNLDTVRANIGFDTLQQMRDNSPTGGALGQVTERELALLQSAWSSLEQSQTEPQFLRNLERVRKQFKESWSRVRRAYEKDFGEPFPEASNASKKFGVGRFQVEVVE